MRQGTDRLIFSMMVLMSIALLTVDASAQNRNRHFVADSGVISLKPHQTLRVTVTPASDNQTYRIRFRRCLFTEQDNVFVVNSSQISPIILLPPTEARSFDTSGQGSGPSVRVRAASNNPNVVVTFQLIDTSTGEINWLMNGIVTEQDIWATPA